MAWLVCRSSLVEPAPDCRVRQRPEERQSGGLIRHRPKRSPVPSDSAVRRDAPYAAHTSLSVRVGPLLRQGLMAVRRTSYGWGDSTATHSHCDLTQTTTKVQADSAV